MNFFIKFQSDKNTFPPRIFGRLDPCRTEAYSKNRVTTQTVLLSVAALFMFILNRANPSEESL